MAMQARLQLQGVLAVGSQQGAALISVDGKPAKPYRVGSAIEDGLQVTSVKARSVSIGQNGAEAFTLELPKQDVNLGLKK
jgi:general secretion pathway protein C